MNELTLRLQEVMTNPEFETAVTEGRGDTFTQAIQRALQLVVLRLEQDRPARPLFQLGVDGLQVCAQIEEPVLVLLAPQVLGR